MKSQPSSSKDIVVSPEPVVNHPIPLNVLPSCLPPVYYRLEFIELLDQRTNEAIENSTARKQLDVDAGSGTVEQRSKSANYGSMNNFPSFDLGISPSKDICQTPIEATTKNSLHVAIDKGKNTMEYAAIHEVGKKRDIKLSDHLRSPYVVRCVDLHINTEDRRVNEWSLSNFGSD